MKVTKFTYGNPDSDGDIMLESDVMIENDSEFDIEFVKGSVIIVNEDGVTIGGEDIDDDGVFIASKDSGELTVLNWTRVKKNQFKDRNGAAAKAYISVTSYRREFVKIGSLDVPSKPGEMTEIKKVISLGGAAECLGMSCVRGKDNDEGEMELEFKAGIRNTSDQYIARAQMTTKARDPRDAQIDDNVDYEALPAKTGKVFEPSFWGLKYGKLKNGSFNVSASVFLPVDTYSAEATPKLSED